MKRGGRRCSPHGGGSGAGAEPSLGWRPARPPPSSASARGRSLAGITPHLISLPGSPQIVPHCRASSSAHRRRLSPALTIPPSSSPLSLSPVDGMGWGRAVRSGWSPSRPRSAERGGRGCQSAGILPLLPHAHVIRPPPRLPSALPPAHPHRGPGGSSGPTLTAGPGAPPDPPDPPALLLTHPIPRGPSRSALTPTVRVSPFPTAARRCRGDAPLSAVGLPPQVRSKPGNTQELPGGHWKPGAWHLPSFGCAKARPFSSLVPENPKHWGLPGSGGSFWPTTYRLTIAPCGLCALQSCPKVGEELFDQFPAMKSIQPFCPFSFLNRNRAPSPRLDTVSWKLLK